MLLSLHDSNDFRFQKPETYLITDWEHVKGILQHKLPSCSVGLKFFERYFM
jgi:hypothetical protein